MCASHFMPHPRLRPPRTVTKDRSRYLQRHQLPHPAWRARGADRRERRGEVCAVAFDPGKGTAYQGEIKIGPSVKVGYYAQEHDTLDFNQTLIDAVRLAGNMSESNAVSFLIRYLFTYQQATQRIGSLSGGERSRLQLALLVLSGANFLLLDEPTNNLDIASAEVLENALNDFNGTVLVISHDRYFLDRTVSRIFALENGSITEYIGGYSDYAAKAGVHAKWAEKLGLRPVNEIGCRASLFRKSDEASGVCHARKSRQGFDGIISARMSQEPSTQKSQICPTCGTRLSENATRCLVCGTELTAKAAAKSKKAEMGMQASRMPEITLSLPAALGALAVILLIGAAAVYFSLRAGITGQTITEPTAEGTATETPTVTLDPLLKPCLPTAIPTETPLPPFDYTVRDGDTCGVIAANFGRIGPKHYCSKSVVSAVFCVGGAGS